MSKGFLQDNPKKMLLAPESNSV